MQSFTERYAGHPFAKTSSALSAFSRVPAGIRARNRTRIVVMRIVPPTSSMSPSTAAVRFSAAGIPRASSALAYVPHSQPPTAAIMWSRVAGYSRSTVAPYLAR